MKNNKILLLCLVMLLSLMPFTEVIAADLEYIKNGDFENGIDGFGICYSSRNDTVMPSLRNSIYVTKDGGALEFLPGDDLEEKSGTGPFSGGIAYQGIYHNATFSVSKNEKYNISIDANPGTLDATMRFIVMQNGKVEEVSEAMTLPSGKWSRNCVQWTPKEDLDNVRVRVAFYNIKYGKSIYLDNFSFSRAFVTYRDWNPLSDERIVVNNAGLTFGVLPEKEGGVYTKIGTPQLIEGAEYALTATVSTQAEKAYVTFSSNAVAEDFIVKKGEHIKICLPFVALAENELRVSAFCTMAGEIELDSIDVVDEYNMISVLRNDGQLIVSGRLREGNENKEIMVQFGDMDSVSTTVDRNGSYKLSWNIPQFNEAERKIRVTVSEFYGYDGQGGELSADYTIKNMSYADSVAQQLRGATKEQVAAILTGEVLDNLGVSAIRAVRTAKVDDVYSYLSGKIISTGVQLIDNITVGGVLSSLNNKRQELDVMTDGYAILLEVDKSNAYHNLYAKADKAVLNTLFKECTIEITDNSSYRKALAETLVRSEMNATSNFSQQLTLLKKYADELGLDFTEFNKLSDDKQYSASLSLLDGIKNRKSYSDLQSRIDNAISNNGQQSGPSGGGNRGGNGGSSSVQAPLIEKIPVDLKEPSDTDYIFSDLSDYKWAEEAIYALTDKGVISRADDFNFNPGKNVTRAEMAKMTAVLYGITEYAKTDIIFNDVNIEDWYYSYVMALYENGIVNGTSENEFGSNLSITRQDICVIFARLLKEENISAQAEFTDIDTAGGYAADAIALMKSKGIVNGYEDGSFRPMDFASRAEIAQILYRFSNLID